MLDAAHSADILIAYSCRGGRCRTCLGRLMSGEVVYPGGLPDALSNEDIENGRVLFCSAHAASDLVIEILRPEF